MAAAAAVGAQSVPGLLDVESFGPAEAAAGAGTLIVEVPHGATETADFEALRAHLTSPLHPRLSDFFHVNTDVGAPELARALAADFVAARVGARAVVLRCRIPRTFIDCNRRIDASPEDFKAGKVTPGLMPWIATPEDRARLRGLSEAYLRAVDAVVAAALPAGFLLLLHSYAPREVGVEVDADIVERLHAAYAPEVEPTWPLRPEVDVIGRDLEGRDWNPSGFVPALRAGLEAVGLTLADGQTYPLHPSTIGHAHVARYPGRVACVEVRRDLLAEPFSPFEQMHIAPAKIDRLRGAFLAAVQAAM